MAEDRNPVESNGGGPAEIAALTARVAELEQAVHALQQQRSIGVADPAPRAAAKLQPIPPPPPLPVQQSAATTSAAGGASGRVPTIPLRPVFSTPGHATAESSRSLESRIGGQLLNRVAIVALLVGAAYGLKLAVDYGWIDPMARVIVGLLLGAGLVLWSERFRAKGFAAFSYSLKAVGTGVLYLSLWAAFRLYGLLPASVALTLMIAVTAWNAYMAWAQDSELLAAYALAGGFATPMLLSTGGNHEIFLFTYLLAMDLATIALVRLRGWSRLLLGAFPLTVVYFIGWYIQFWHAEELSATCFFIAAFAAAFVSVSVGPRVADSSTPSSRTRMRSVLLEDILLPLVNAAFAALAFYSVLEDSGHHDLLPWLMVMLAAVYLALMRTPQTRTASAIHLSLAVVFLTIAIPLKASGHWITVSWLVEGLALMWVAARLGGMDEDTESAQAARVLRPLASAALLLGFCGMVFHVLDLLELPSLDLVNRGTGTALTAIAVFSAVAWLAHRANAAYQSGSAAWSSIVTGSVLLIDITAALLTLRELGISWRWAASHPAFRSADFLTALLGLAVLAGVVAVARQLARKAPDDGFWIMCAAGSAVAFNLIAVLTGVREVSAAFAPPLGAWNADAALQQALAISAWLMFYGALLLAVGFWRRSAFLRWQALALLLFTILKTFLYDMRSLSQGYRVASFLALGALLMVISFAYQKDWLNLRGSEAAHAAEESRSSREDAG